jgi:predicted dehydrogenase
MEMPKTYRVGLVGCGRMGATIDDEVKDRPNAQLYLPYSHAAAIVACERMELVAVSDPVAAKALAAQERYGAAHWYADYREMIEKEALDVVSVATRPGPHAEIVVFAARSGVRGVYCEKPLCNAVREMDAMLEACSRAGVKFNYGTQRRYTALYRNARRLLEAGEIGQVQAVLAHCGAGAAQWGLTHAADMILFLAGDGEVEYAQGTVLAEEIDWEGDRLKIDARVTSGYVAFKNGVHAYLTASGGWEFEISGTKGKLRTLSNGQGYTLRKADEHGGFHPVEAPPVPMESGTLRGMEDLVRALDEDGETQGPLGLACRSQEIIFAIAESHRQGGARVKLPLVNRNLAIAPDNY